MIYLAAPYSDPDPKVRKKRFEMITRIAATMCEMGLKVFSPITHGHPIIECVNGSLPTGWEYWEEFDRKILSACNTIAVLHLPGWERSRGVQAEIKIAEELGLRRSDIDPDTWI